MAKQVELDRVYMRMAYAIAELSQAKRKKVGAILVAAKGGIIAEGFNGTPAGFDNNCENIVREHLVTKPEVLHAESNAIMKVARSTNNSDGATLYAVLSPCIECAKLIIQAGIKRVVYSEVYPLDQNSRQGGLDLLAEANILVERLDIYCLATQDSFSHDRELEATEPLAPEDSGPAGV